MQNVKVYYMPNSNDSFVKETDADNAIKLERNKAIDDFANVLLSNQTIDRSVIKRVREQLKSNN